MTTSTEDSETTKAPSRRPPYRTYDEWKTRRTYFQSAALVLFTVVLALLAIVLLRGEIEDSALRVTGFAAAGVIATLLGLFGILFQINLSQTTDFEDRAVNRVSERSNQLYELIQSRYDEFVRWTDSFDESFDFVVFAGLLADLYSAKTIDDIPDYIYWRTAIGPLTRGASTVRAKANEVKLRLEDQDSELDEEEERRKLDGIGWTFHSDVVPVIDQIDWHIQMANWARFRRSGRLTQLVIIVAVVSIVTSFGWGLLASITTDSANGPYVDDSWNVVTGAVIWILLSTTGVLIAEAVDVLLTPQSKYIRSVVDYHRNKLLPSEAAHQQEQVSEQSSDTRDTPDAKPKATGVDDSPV